MDRKVCGICGKCGFDVYWNWTKWKLEQNMSRAVKLFIALNTEKRVSSSSAVWIKKLNGTQVPKKKFGQGQKFREDVPSCSCCCNDQLFLSIGCLKKTQRDGLGGEQVKLRAGTRSTGDPAEPTTSSRPFFFKSFAASCPDRPWKESMGLYWSD